MVIKEQIIPTEVLLVSLTEAKKQLRVDADFTEEDDLITSYIEAAQEHASNYVGFDLPLKKVVISLSSFDTFTFQSRNPLTALEKVEFLAPDAEEFSLLPTEQSLITPSNTGNYLFDCKFIGTLPELNADALVKVKVTFNFGYLANNCPKAVKQAVKILISDFYDRRENKIESYDSAFLNLLRGLRVY